MFAALVLTCCFRFLLLIILIFSYVFECNFCCITFVFSCPFPHLFNILFIVYVCLLQVYFECLLGSLVLTGTCCFHFLLLLLLFFFLLRHLRFNYVFGACLVGLFFCVMFSAVLFLPVLTDLLPLVYWLFCDLGLASLVPSCCMFPPLCWCCFCCCYCCCC